MRRVLAAVVSAMLLVPVAAACTGGREADLDRLRKALGDHEALAAALGFERG